MAPEANAFDPSCIFCRISRGQMQAAIVFQTDTVIAFLDHRPVFPGHCLLLPRAHVPTLADLAPANVGGFFRDAQMLAQAVETGMAADGAFLAINNKVSQSVLHLHMHVIPRRRKDGLKGFFWPRRPYPNEEEMKAVQQAIKAAIEKLTG